MPEEAYLVLQAIADEQRRPLADVIREALEEYAERHDHTLSFDVQRGGYRSEQSVSKQYFVIHNETSNPKFIRHVGTSREWVDVTRAMKGPLQRITRVDSPDGSIRLAILSRKTPSAERQQEILRETEEFIEADERFRAERREGKKL
jgi:predicted DNA-binding protein